MPYPDLPPGWLEEAEYHALRELAAGSTVLEVGCWLGRSTVAMAEVAEFVVTCDHFEGGPDLQENSNEHSATLNGGVWTFPAFWTGEDGIKARGLAEKVIPVLGDFRRTAHILRPYRFGLVYVDADHSREATLQIGRLAAALAAPGAPVVFHDYADGWPGVIAAVDELCGDFGRPVRLGGSLVRLPIITAGIQPVPRSRAI